MRKVAKAAKASEAAVALEAFKARDKEEEMLAIVVDAKLRFAGAKEQLDKVTNTLLECLDRKSTR